MNFSMIPQLLRKPNARATIKGSGTYPNLKGTVSFYQTRAGVMVLAQVSGLPKEPPYGVFGFHLHSGNRCSGNETDPFADAMGHYNPKNMPHPYHAGDMPPLFGVGGSAFLAFLTDRFTVREVMGKTVILHRNPDDFTTQPAGNAGEKMACGVIEEK